MGNKGNVYRHKNTKASRNMRKAIAKRRENKTNIVESAPPPLQHTTSKCESTTMYDYYDLSEGLQISYTRNKFDFDSLGRVFKGNRIFNPVFFISWFANLILYHSSNCSGTLFLKNEIRQGLNSLLVFYCDICKKEARNSFEESRDSTRSRLNGGAVWGTLASGMSYTATQTVFNCMDVPFMTSKTFVKYERLIGETWDKQLSAEIESAGKEEYELALKNQRVTNGIADITVMVDGGWSKRSYGHSYNANSGVAVIIGEATNKILYMGVRNKYCSICALAENKETTPKYHKCFRNWKDKPSSQMEADIIVEGFNRSVEMHNLRYTKFIADGDSSVYARIKERVCYRNDVTKVECSNHVIKNYTSHLHKICKNTTLPIKGRSLLKKNMSRLTLAARYAIKYNSGKGTTETLRSDLANGPSHVFGEHSKCREYFCKRANLNEPNFVPDLQKDGIFDLILNAVELIRRKAERLSIEATSNQAETFMSLVAKYTSGKRLNLIQRDSYERRCTIAALQFQKGNQWHEDAYKLFYNTSPGCHFSNIINRKNRRGKELKKRFVAKPSKTPIVDPGYGEQAEDFISEEDIVKRCNEFIKKFEISDEEISTIEEKSRGQHGNLIYDKERSERLTASLYGKICKKKEYTSCHGMVRECLLNKQLYNEDIRYGLKNEDAIRQKFSIKYNKSIRTCGLHIYKKYPFLAASPDGIVDGESALIEIKTFPSVKRKLGENSTFQEAAKEIRSFCLESIEGKLSLKKNHNYYFQVQGQMEICNREMCYFIGYIDDNVELYVEEIKRDRNFWNTIMENKLTTFYKDCVARELILDRLSKGWLCSDPPSIVEAKKLHEEANENKKKRKNSCTSVSSKKPRTDCSNNSEEIELDLLSQNFN